MRVLVLTPSLASVGGIQRYTSTLIRALKDLLGERNVRAAALPETIAGGGGSFPAAVKLRFGWQALRELLGSRPDLIICTHLGLGPVGWLLATVGERPYWIVVHGIEAWGALPYAKRAALRQADRVIVTSAFSRERVVTRQGIDRECLASLPCALDDRLLGRDAASGAEDVAATAAWNGLGRYFADGRRVILTVARMSASEQYKGHDVVLRALPGVVAQVPNLTYAVAGDGDDRARLERLAGELGLADHVAFTGAISDAALARLYRRSEIFVLPARTVIEDRHPKGEGFGIVYLEAMAFGKPVIGPNDGAPAELIRDGENGLLVSPEDPRSVGEALLRLLGDPMAARAMGERGGRWVNQHYSYDCFRERLREVLAA
jgi:phosphatidylinositol alpha-1,6-mannosyltransferase